MEEIILLIIILFLLVMFIYGYKKGIVGLVLSIVLTIVSIVLSFVLLNPLENFLRDNTPLYDTVYDGVKSAVETSGEKFIPDILDEKIQDSPETKAYIDRGIDDYNDYLAGRITDMFIRITAFVLIFICIKLISFLIVEIAGLATMIPVINMSNKFLGGLVGLVYGVLIVWCVFIIITMFGGTEIGSEILRAITEDRILNSIYSSNVLMEYLIK